MSNQKMTTRKLGNIREDISLLGFGCMRFPKVDGDDKQIDENRSGEMIDYAMKQGVNYYDTAYPYHEGMSEVFMGKVLKNYPRDSFYLASKLPIWLLESEEDPQKYFNEQLEKCQVDYFDFYLLHNLNEEGADKVAAYKAYEFIKRMKEKGKIRYIGFSFHGSPELLKQNIDTYDVDFVQIQLNYLDWDYQNAKAQYEMLVEKDIPVIVMEPVRGGTLANLSDASQKILKDAAPDASIASWAMRYAASLPGVITVLSGMSTMEQVEDNAATLQGFMPLTDEERKTLDEALKAYRSSGTIPCTGCRYCMDCPVGVDIPHVFEAYNEYQIRESASSFKRIYDEVVGQEKQAANCVSCGNCTPLCPQGIDIPEWMGKVTALATSL